MFDDAVRRDETRLHHARSHFEMHNQAITLRDGLWHHDDACSACGEVAHIHPSDGSMHMILSASDTRSVIERGWGERHGLAGITLGLPATYVLIYAPRSAADVAVIARILDAAIAYMSLDPKS